MSAISDAIELLRRECATNLEAVVAALDRRRATTLTQVLHEPSPMERAREFCAIGWVMPEVEFLQREMTPGETIRSFDAWGVTTNKRTIDRAALRSKSRPGTWSREDTWLAQFPGLPSR
jgi:hypothetical protein